VYKVNFLPLGYVRRKGDVFFYGGQSFEQPSHVPALYLHDLQTLFVFHRFVGVVSVHYAPRDARGDYDSGEAEVVVELAERGYAAGPSEGDDGRADFEGHGRAGAEEAVKEALERSGDPAVVDRAAEDDPVRRVQ